MRTHAHASTHKRTRTHTFTQTHSHIYTHTRTHTHTHIHTYTQHTHKHTRTHIHTRMKKYKMCPSLIWSEQWSSVSSVRWELVIHGRRLPRTSHDARLLCRNFLESKNILCGPNVLVRGDGGGLIESSSVDSFKQRAREQVSFCLSVCVYVWVA